MTPMVPVSGEIEGLGIDVQGDKGRDRGQGYMSIIHNLIRISKILILQGGILMVVYDYPYDRLGGGWG